MKRVAVTGVCGFVGRYVVKELLKNNIEVIGIDLSEQRAKEFEWYSKITYISFDLNDKCDNYYELFLRPDALIHLAWEGLPNYSELFHIEKNLFNSYLFIKNLIEHGLLDITVTGTCLEYGLSNGCLNENSDTRPVNAYGIAKDCLRKFIEELSRHYQFSFKWARLFFTYGDGQSKNSLLELLKQALVEKAESFNMSGGEQLRDYLHIEKVAEYIVKIALQKKIYGIINCCSGNPVSVRTVVENYLKESNKTIRLNLGYYPYPTYEPMAFWGDNRKLTKILNDIE
jgi:nucleoside-diphosphate-sugar epimerase